MFRFRKIGTKELVSVIGLCSLSSTITIIPDILTLFRFNYVGYTIVPLLLLVLIVLIRDSTKKIITERFVLFYSILFLFLYSVSFIAGLWSGTKSLVSGSIFLFAFGSFIFFANSSLLRKYYFPILKIYIKASLFISFLVVMTFVILAVNLTDINSWIVSWPFNEKFELKFEKFSNSKLAFSYVGYLSLILTNNTSLVLGLNLNPYGDFCGLSYESSLGLLYSSVGFLFSLDFYKRKKKFFLILGIFVLHVLLGFSLTNLSSILIVSVTYLFLNSSRNYSRLLLLILIMSFLPLVADLYLTMDIVEYKINSRSYDDSVSSIYSLFKGGFLGEGVFTTSYNPGILSSFILVIYYLFVLKIMNLAYSKKLMGITVGLMYMILHSLKFPFIYIQLPFSFWIPLLGYYYAKYYNTVNTLPLPFKASKRF